MQFFVRMKCIIVIDIAASLSGKTISAIMQPLQKMLHCPQQIIIIMYNMCGRSPNAAIFDIFVVSDNCEVIT